MDVLNINEKIEFGAKPIARTLLNQMGIRVLLLCVRKGQIVPEHTAPGPITVQALTGHTTFYDGETAVDMKPGALLLLEAGRPHRLEVKEDATEDATLLVTIFDSRSRE